MKKELKNSTRPRVRKGKCKAAMRKAGLKRKLAGGGISHQLFVQMSDEKIGHVV